jgi:serine/threonine protein kinase
VAFEYALGGELFDYISLVTFSTNVVQFVSRQILNAIHHKHNQGLPFGGLKLQDIMFD